MRKIVTILLILTYLGISSCVTKTNKEEKPKNDKVTKNILCDKFLENYEEIMDEYLKVVEEYFNNPTDEAVAARYMDLMQETLELTEEWEGLVDCADDPNYKDKFEAISIQVEDKLNELGL